MTRTLTFLLLTCLTALAQTNYTEAMYRRALDNQSTSPSFVLVTLRDNADTRRLVCIPASFVLGAIHTEYHLDYDENGQRKALAMAIAQPDRVFFFSNPKARSNVEPRYSPEVLAEVRRILASATDSDLRAELSTSNSRLHRIYQAKKPFAEFATYRDTVGHILLERGILVGIGDLTGCLQLPMMAKNQFK
jgi:hypothetical protein